MANPDFEGKVLVVTGGTQGLGEAITRRLAEAEPLGIVVSGRNSERGKHIAHEISQNGVRAVFVPADLANINECRAVIAMAKDAFGRLDGLINAAGLTARSNILETTPELFDQMLAVNLRGPFFLMQEAIRLMRSSSNQGTIVNILSAAIHGGPPNLVAYAASKAALASVTRNTAYAVLPDRIRVNAVAPGWIDTPGENMVQRAQGRAEDWQLEAGQHLPFGRLISPEEIAELVAFLSSARSGLMTGAIIDYDQKIAGAQAQPPAPPIRLSDPLVSREL